MFSDFKICEVKFHLLTSFISIDIEIVDENVQLKVVDNICDSLLKENCMIHRIPEFCTYLSVHRFPKL